MGRGRGEHPPGRRGHLRVQPPLLLRLRLPAARRSPPGDLPRQERLLHRARRQGPAHRGVLQGHRPGARRPVGRQGEQRRPQLGPEGPAPRRPARHLSRGHALARRPALPRAHRGGPDGARGPRHRHPRRDDRHRQGAADGQGHPAHHAGRGARREAARLLALRGHGGRPLRPALDHRRDHVRADDAVGPGVRRHVRDVDEGPSRRRGPRQGPRAAGGGQARAAAPELEAALDAAEGTATRLERARESLDPASDAGSGEPDVDERPEDEGPGPVVAAS